MKKIRDYFTPFGRRARGKLVELGHDRRWLIEQIGRRTGIFLADGYMCRILRGEERAPSVIRESMRDTLGIR